MEMEVVSVSTAKFYALLCFPLVKAIVNTDNKYLGYMNFLPFIKNSLNSITSFKLFWKCSILLGIKYEDKMQLSQIN